MAKDTITLVLNGEVSLPDFACAVTELQKLLEALQTDVVEGVDIKWLIQSLDAGSAIAEIKGQAQNERDGEAIEKVVDAYLDVGRSLKERSPIKYPHAVHPVRRIAALITERLTSVRFETEEDEAELFESPERILEAPSEVCMPEKSYGAVRGRIQTMSNRGGLRFTLYDIIDDHAISCYLAPGSEELMRNAWGKLADVEGFVSRHPETARPTTVRKVKTVRIIPEVEPDSWRQAIGASPNFLGETKPEDIIRKGRDAR